MQHQGPRKDQPRQKKLLIRPLRRQKQPGNLQPATEPAVRPGPGQRPQEEEHLENNPHHSEGHFHQDGRVRRNRLGGRSGQKGGRGKVSAQGLSPEKCCAAAELRVQVGRF